MASWFGHVEPAAKDPILGVTEAFLADPSPDKVNVGVVRICSLPPPPPFHHELSRLIPELCVCVFAAGRVPGRQREARGAGVRARGGAADRREHEHVRSHSAPLFFFFFFSSSLLFFSSSRV